jgi:hypothetical protein
MSIIVIFDDWLGTWKMTHFWGIEISFDFWQMTKTPIFTKFYWTFITFRKGFFLSNWVQWRQSFFFLEGVFNQFTANNTQLAAFLELSWFKLFFKINKCSLQEHWSSVFQRNIEWNFWQRSFYAQSQQCFEHYLIIGRCPRKTSTQQLLIILKLH